MHKGAQPCITVSRNIPAQDLSAFTRQSRVKSRLFDLRTRIPSRLLRGKALCHIRIVTLKLAANAFQDDFWPVGPFQYQRYQPENTLLYQLIKEHWPGFQNMLAEQGRGLPGYIVREFEDYLKCGCLEHGFLRVCCDTCRGPAAHGLGGYRSTATAGKDPARQTTAGSLKSCTGYNRRQGAPVSRIRGVVLA